MDEEIASSVDDLNWLVGDRGGASQPGVSYSTTTIKSFARLANGHKVSLQSIRRDLARFNELEKKFPGTDQQAFRELAR